MSIALHACHKSSRADVLMNAPQPGNYTHYLIKPQDERAPGLVFFLCVFLIACHIYVYVVYVTFPSIPMCTRFPFHPSIHPCISLLFSPPFHPFYATYTQSQACIYVLFSRLLPSRTQFFGADEIIAEWLKSINFPRRD